MELYHFRSVVTVANEGHLTRTAKRLFISQPAVSAHIHIKSLEEKFGMTLFTRSVHGMQLTHKGQLPKVQAEKSLNAIHDIFQQAKRLRHDVVDIVKIGLHTTPNVLKTGFALICALYIYETANNDPVIHGILNKLFNEVL